MALKVPVAHDFTCPWCWIGLSQAKRLRRELGVVIDWLGYELWPVELDWPEDGPPQTPENPNRPKTPTRLALAYAAEGIDPPPVLKKPRIRTHNAHEAVEHAKTLGVADEFVERLYRAYWTQAMDISDPMVLRLLATGLIRDVDAMLEAIAAKKYAANIVGFDDRAYEKGVYNVPTFFINGERYAEQTYRALAAALDKTPAEGPPYPGLAFPTGPEDRPYVAINMVATIDGKILTGERNENVMDLGSKADHAAMREIQAAVDGIMIGAGSLRATKGLWYPSEKARFVVSTSGDIDQDGRFFTDTPDRAYIVGFEGPVKPANFKSGGEVNLAAALKKMRAELGIERLLVEGGSELNAALLAENLVDELFLTVAPKVKLGRDIPTYAGGKPLPREAVQNYELVSHIRLENEIFLRYRRA